jgi:hypothetical protein
MAGFDDQGDTIAAPDNYPSKGTGERGTFFYDSEGNLIGIAQPVRNSDAGLPGLDPLRPGVGRKSQNW